MQQNAVERHRMFLEDRMDPDFGLADKLYANSVLTKGELHDVKEEKTSERRNKWLLDLILEKNDEDELMTALRDTEQKHLVNYLDSDGVYNSEIVDDWPLREREMKILKINHESLIDLLDTNDLCILLYSRHVINGRQRDFISSRSSDLEKNAALLDIVGRFSLRQYQKTIECLHESKQSHIAEILAEGGVVVKAHSEVSASAAGVHVHETEDVIVKGMCRLLKEKSCEEADLLIKLLIAVRKGESVVLYFYCKTLEDFIHLYEMVKNEQLKFVVQKIFQQLLPDINVVEVKCSEDEYKKQKMFLSEYNAEESSDIVKTCFTRETVVTTTTTTTTKETITTTRAATTTTTLCDLPLEVLDMILLKAGRVSMVTGSESIHKKRDAEIISSFASVDECWFQRILRPRFKKRMMQLLKTFYGKIGRRSTFIRDNRNYLSETMRSKADLINRLRSVDCLTDKETRFINAQKHDKDKNEELLNVVGSLDVDRYDRFTGQLFQRKQELLGRVVSCAGGVVEKCVIHHHMKKDSSANASAAVNKEEQQMIRKLNELQNNRADKVEQLIKKTEKKKIEILSSTDDNGILVWLWCQSVTGLKTLKKMQESNDLLEFLSHLFESISPENKWNSGSIKPEYVDAETEKLKKRVGLSKGSINYRLNPPSIQTIVPKEMKSMSGITILNKELFIVAESDSRIDVYDSINFSLHRTWNLAEVTNPRDIVSSERYECLFINNWTDDRKQTGEIIRTNPNGSILGKWSTEANYGVLSVTDESNVILTVWRENKLNEYSPDGQLIRQMILPSDSGIVRPLHAIKLTDGTFLVSHGWYSSDNLHRVCKVDVDGNVIKSFGGRKGSDEGHLNVPSYMAVDEDRSIMVSDEVNGRVLLLSSNLEFKRMVVAKKQHKFVAPREINLDRSNGRLLVIDNFRLVILGIIN